MELTRFTKMVFRAVFNISFYLQTWGDCRHLRRPSQSQGRWMTHLPGDVRRHGFSSSTPDLTTEQRKSRFCASCAGVTPDLDIVLPGRAFDTRLLLAPQGRVGDSISYRQLLACNEVAETVFKRGVIKQGFSTGIAGLLVVTPLTAAPCRMDAKRAVSSTQMGC